MKIEEWVMKLCLQKCLPELLYPARIQSHPAKTLPCYTLLPYQNTTEAFRCLPIIVESVLVNLWNSQFFKCFSQPWEWYESLLVVSHQKKSPRFVPTMGNLHEGHLELIDAALQRGDEVLRLVASGCHVAEQNMENSNQCRLNMIMRGYIYIYIYTSSRWF